MTNKNNIAFKVKEYLFHLSNANDENGIRPFEGWKFARVDLSGKKAIEHGYYPTVVAEIGAKDMDDFSQSVLQELGLNYPKVHVSDHKIPSSVGDDYFVAFCADRVRR